MAIKYGFFNSIGGDRKYTAADIGNYLMGIVSSGVYADNSTSLQVLAGGGMSVEVQPGRAMLHYHYMENDSPLVLNLAAGSTQARVDAIVALVDMNNRLCDIVVKQGTEGASPVAPAMERSDTLKEYMLASVHIPRLSNAITQANITDTRADNTVCGFVTGVIDQVDTSTLFKQWTAAFDKAVAEMDAWYEGLTENYVDGNNLPIPNPGDAGKALHVNETGDGFALLPAVKIERNLLDNSDFRNPVNRMGFTGGVPSVDNSYFIDRWQTQQSVTKNVEISLTAAGLIIHVSTGLAGIRQSLPAPKTDVTFAAKVNGKIALVHAVHGEDESIKTEDDILLYVEWLDNVLQVLIRNSGDKGNEYTIEWAAVYEGEYTAETLPEYKPKGYAAEVLGCNVSDTGNANGMELIWQNASPASSFAKQTVGISLADYIGVFIYYKNQTGGSVYNSTGFIGKGEDFTLVYVPTTSSSATVTRKGSVDDNGVSFLATSNDNSGYDIPLKIYGIKGVIA